MRTAARDLHSGRYGGPVGNAVMVLARLLATLHDEQQRIAVARLLRRAAPAGQRRLSRAWRRSASTRRHSSPKSARGPARWSPACGCWKSLWFRPTLEVNGIIGGYNGPGGKTVIPAEARAKITCRLGPGQVPSTSARRSRRICARIARAWADIEIREPQTGTAAYAVPEDDPFLAVVERVIEQVHGKQAGARRRRRHAADLRRWRRRRLGLETVMLSYAIADERIHAPNEFFRLSSFDEGLKAWTRALEEFARV